MNDTASFNATTLRELEAEFNDKYEAVRTAIASETVEFLIAMLGGSMDLDEAMQTLGGLFGKVENLGRAGGIIDGGLAALAAAGQHDATLVPTARTLN